MTSLSLQAQQLRAVLGLIWATIGLIWTFALLGWFFVAAYRYEKLSSTAHFQTLTIVLLLLCWDSAASRRKSV